MKINKWDKILLVIITIIVSLSFMTVSFSLSQLNYSVPITEYWIITLISLTQNEGFLFFTAILIVHIVWINKFDLQENIKGKTQNAND